MTTDTFCSNKFNQGLTELEKHISIFDIHRTILFMKSLSETVNRNMVYLIFCLTFAIVLSLYCIFLNKPDGFLLVNHFHNRLLDNFFILFTNFGNGLFTIGLILVMVLRKKVGWSIQSGISFMVSGLLSQILKHLVHSPRPRLFFRVHEIHWIYGITRTGNASFPSGHTATIFALATLLSLYFPGRKTGILFFLIAALTGFSRIYLSDHFPIDVLGGLVIGVLTSMAVYVLFPHTKFERKLVKNEMEPQSANLQ
jgi:membrane-associated phospholipid phosphatase